MIRNTLALSLAAGLGLCLMAPATFAAAPTLYGSVEFSHLKASGAEYPYEFAVDATATNFTELPGVGFNSGDDRSLRMGLDFSSPLFVELAITHANLNGTAPALTGADSSPCIASNNFYEADCSTTSNFTSNYRRSNTDLIAGWAFQLTPKTTLSPYLGIRRMKFDDVREGLDTIPFSSDGVFQQTVATHFSHTGWVAGLRFKQEFATRGFVKAEIQQAHASGDRDHTLDGTLTDALPGGSSVGATQRMWRAEVGFTFAMGPQRGSLSLGYQDLRHGGLDTTQFTATDGGPTLGSVYVPNYAALGDRNDSLSMR